MGILMSSLSPYNNDLYASNLAGISVLAIHGSDDDNVPPRHSRQHIALIEAWAQSSTHTNLVEVPKKGHWWDDVLSLQEVYDFIDTLVKSPPRDWEEDRKKGFTITTANPDESGGKSGVRILELNRPGRLARLDVNGPQWEGEPRGEKGMFHGMNVRRFSYQPVRGGAKRIMTQTNGIWSESGDDFSPDDRVRRYGPMIRLLASQGPMNIIADPSNSSAWSVALRYAHDLYLYHRIAVNVLSDDKALQHMTKDELFGNLVTVGRSDENRFTAFIAHLLGQTSSIPLSFHEPGVIRLAGRDIWETGTGEYICVVTALGQLTSETGVISLHPHPTSSAFSFGLACIVAGNDTEGLELAARLLPLRTGVPVCSIVRA
jgi:hypothetical protein